MISIVALLGWQLNQFLLATSLRAAAVLAAACGLSLIFSLFRTSAASRHMLWSLAVGGALGVPFLFGILPSCNIVLPWAELTPPQVAIERPAADPNLGVELLAWTSPVESASPQSIQPAPENVAIRVLAKKTASVSASERADLHTTPRIPWLFLTWLTGACLAIVPTCLGLASLRRLGRNSQTVTSGPLFVALQRATRQLATQWPVQLLTSADRSMPMTWGFWRPTILLPTVAESWSRDRLQVVLLHELAHVERGDCLVQFIGQIARAVYWFNPLAWIAVRQIRIEQEQASDDFVLCRGFNAPDYAEHLLAVSAWCSPASGYSLALAIASPSKLERRLVSILNPQQNRRPLSRRGRRLVAALAIAITALVSVMHFESAVAGTDDAAIQKAADNGQAAAPAKQSADRAKTLADLRSKIAEQYVTPVNENEIVQGAI
ncbi:MAG TPA: M56 family metallopeptidase, partial [Pirellulaceae bacterium]|nr:M56 family metallopeptidase [Pirellulaceae bacterium]